jgi:hypothetical protein
MAQSDSLAFGPLLIGEASAPVTDPEDQISPRLRTDDDVRAPGAQ